MNNEDERAIYDLRPLPWEFALDFPPTLPPGLSSYQEGWPGLAPPNSNAQYATNNATALSVGYGLAAEIDLFQLDNGGIKPNNERCTFTPLEGTLGNAVNHAYFAAANGSLGNPADSQFEAGSSPGATITGAWNRVETPLEHVDATPVTYDLSRTYGNLTGFPNGFDPAHMIQSGEGHRGQDLLQISSNHWASNAQDMTCGAPVAIADCSDTRNLPESEVHDTLCNVGEAHTRDPRRRRKRAAPSNASDAQRTAMRVQNARWRGLKRYRFRAQLGPGGVDRQPKDGATIETLRLLLQTFRDKPDCGDLEDALSKNLTAGASFRVISQGESHRGISFSFADLTVDSVVLPLTPENVSVLDTLGMISDPEQASQSLYPLRSAWVNAEAVENHAALHADPWPGIRWKDGPLTDVSRDSTNEPETLRLFRIDDTENCQEHGTADCLVLIEKEGKHCGTSLKFSISCRQSIPEGHRPLAACRACSEDPSIGLLVRASRARQSPTSGTTIRWLNGSFFRLKAHTTHDPNKRVEIEPGSMNPTCPDHQMKATWKMRHEKCRGDR